MDKAFFGVVIQPPPKLSVPHWQQADGEDSAAQRAIRVGLLVTYHMGHGSQDVGMEPGDSGCDDGKEIHRGNGCLEGRSNGSW